VQYVSNLSIVVVVVVVVVVQEVMIIIIIIILKPVVWELDNTRNGLRQSQIIIMSPVIIFSINDSLTRIQMDEDSSILGCECHVMW
jgi:hypothetical protein